ncbi:unnamed protein product [Cercospora beticola]|nr:unnamed protein product [Cercospora beticola]
MRAGVKTETLLFIGDECHTTASGPGIAAPDRTPWRQHGSAKSDRDTGEQPPGRAAIMAGVADKSLHDTPKPSNDHRVCCTCEVTGLRPSSSCAAANGLHIISRNEMTRNFMWYPS